MEFFRKLHKKISEGWLQELRAEGLWLLQYVRHYRRTVLIHLLLDVLAIAMGLASSVASKYLIDAVSGRQSALLLPAAAGMAGMLLGSIALNSLSARIGAKLNIRVENEIQAEVYGRILGTDWESLSDYHSGDLLKRLTADTGTVAGGVTGFAPGLLAALLRFFGALCIMLIYDPAMAGIALLGVPAAALCSRLLVGRMRDHSRRMKRLSGELLSFYEDSLANLTSIKAFGVTGSFREQMLRLQGTYREEYLTYNRFSVRTSVFLSLLGLLVSASCFGWGVYRLWQGAISFGTMTLFLQLAGTLSGAFSALMGMASAAVSLSTSAGRLMELTGLNAETAGPAPDLRSQPSLTLEVHGAGFTYRDGRRVLQDVELSAGAEELIALTGPSGEGKTTLLRLLLGLIAPQEGEAFLRCNGEKLPLSAATRSAFAYVPQGGSLFAGTIRENLLLTRPEATEAELQTALRIACAEEFVQQLPDGLEHAVGGREKGLSEGQAQRLAIARALLRGAPILLLDEATSALDGPTEERLLRNLMDSGLVHTCIFVTHRPGALRFCTRQYAVEGRRVYPVTAEGKDGPR